MLKPYSTCLGVSAGSSGQLPVFRWTAPVPGDYQIFADFWGASYQLGNTPQGTSSAVYVVIDDRDTLFQNNIDGFIGGNNHAAIGAKPAVSFASGILTLSAGQSIDFIASDNNSLGTDVTGIDGSVVLVRALADINGDGKLDFADVAELSSQWLQHQPATGDLKKDNVINFKDFAILMESWSF
jgi:hypothetical protein